MKQNIKIAKELVKLAKSLIAEQSIDEQTQRKLDEAKAQGKKYILHHKEGDLWRIITCRDILLYGGLLVQAGDFGGLIKSEDNLSHKSNCWVDYGAKVTGIATIEEMATISGNATVSLKAKVYGFANITEDAEISDNAKIYGNAYICGSSQIYEKAQIFGGAAINGTSKIHGKAKVDYDVDDEEITE